MPLTFPSHQGLILPLQRRFPRHLDAVALGVGAALPDIVDLVAWPVRGELGRWVGHSLLGVVVSVPVGLALTWLAPRTLRSQTVPRLARDALSVAVGSLSHVLFDLVTHGSLRLLWPWHVDPDAFPSWWYHTWAHIPLPFHPEPYPFAPHTIAWILLSIVGAVLFVRYLRRPAPVS